MYLSRNLINKIAMYFNLKILFVYVFVVEFNWNVEKLACARVQFWVKICIFI